MFLNFWSSKPRIRIGSGYALNQCGSTTLLYGSSKNEKTTVPVVCIPRLWTCLASAYASSTLPEERRPVICLGVLNYKDKYQGTGWFALFFEKNKKEHGTPQLTHWFWHKKGQLFINIPIQNEPHTSVVYMIQYQTITILKLIFRGRRNKTV